MRPFVIDIDVATADADGLSNGVLSSVVQILLTSVLTAGESSDGIANGNTSAGTSVELDGTLTNGGSYTDATGIARHIRILDAGGHTQTGSTYTLTGTGSNGRALIESIAGPASSAFVITTGRFATITSVAIASPTASSTVDIGVNGVFTSADGLAHQINITDADTDVQTGATYTITGTDADGVAETESRAGPGSGATVETAKYFKTVTSITIASPVAGSSIDIGTVDEVLSQTLPLNYRVSTAATYAVDITGTIVYHVQETLDDIHSLDNPSADATWFDLAALSGKNEDLIAVGTVGVRAARLRVESYNAAAELQWTTTQTASHGS